VGWEQASVQRDNGSVWTHTPTLLDDRYHTWRIRHHNLECQAASATILQSCQYPADSQGHEPGEESIRSELGWMTFRNAHPTSSDKPTYLQANYAGIIRLNFSEIDTGVIVVGATGTRHKLTTVDQRPQQSCLKKSAPYSRMFCRR
jgi:hypothetical protein